MNGRPWLGLGLAALLCVPCISWGAAPSHEIWFGVGGGASPEKSIFNITPDLESVPEAVVSLGYLKHLDDRRAIGVHFYGGAETTPVVTLIGPSGTTSTGFDLTTLNIGIRYRHMFTRSTMLPYAFAGLNWATGTIESAATGELQYQGYSACVGPGVGIELGQSFMLSAEMFASFGSAEWDQQPFLNSSGKDFDPSLMGGTLNISVVWGR